MDDRSDNRQEVHPDDVEIEVDIERESGSRETVRDIEHDRSR